MCDASQDIPGYILLIEDHTTNNDELTKAEAPVASDFRRFANRQLSLTIYDDEFLATYFAFDEFVHILWVNEKFKKLKTDKSLIRYFQPEQITLKLCDQAFSSLRISSCAREREPSRGQTVSFRKNTCKKVHLKSLTPLVFAWLSGRHSRMRITNIWTPTMWVHQIRPCLEAYRRKTIIQFMVMETRHDVENDYKYGCRQELIREQLRHHNTFDPDYFLQLFMENWKHHSVNKQVNP